MTETVRVRGFLCRLTRYGGLALAGCVLALATGCVAPPLHLFKKEEAAKRPTDSMLLDAGVTKAAYTIDPELQREITDAKMMFAQNEYGKAEPVFAKLANNQRNPVPIAEEARYLEAECQRLTGNYRKAEGTYKKLMQDFHRGEFTDKANRRLFDIANYWLDPTRKQMEAYEAKRAGKRVFVKPLPIMNFTNDRPLFDIEGRAMASLEAVRLNDINGPLGEKALFYLATVKFYRAEYNDADYFYSQLYENFPNSPLATKAVKQAIICKQMATGGSVYDCRTLEEARKLIDTSIRAYPELADKEEEWLRRQLVGINLYQADRDFKIAEFYRRTAHPGSAYFYYELVRRRYPGTDYHDKAVQRMAEMRQVVDEEHRELQQETLANAQDQTQARPVSSGQRAWWQFWPASRREDTKKSEDKK